MSITLSLTYKNLFIFAVLHKLLSAINEFLFLKKPTRFNKQQQLYQYQKSITSAATTTYFTNTKNSSFKYVLSVLVNCKFLILVDGRSVLPMVKDHCG